MDEVDGMAGNEDRGGLQELVGLIKHTEVPIVCICNDRYNTKVKTLSTHSYDLKFQKLRVEQIRVRLYATLVLRDAFNRKTNSRINRIPFFFAERHEVLVLQGEHQDLDGRSRSLDRIDESRHSTSNKSFGVPWRQDGSGRSDREELEQRLQARSIRRRENGVQRRSTEEDESERQDRFIFPRLQYSAAFRARKLPSSQIVSSVPVSVNILFAYDKDVIQ